MSTPPSRRSARTNPPSINPPPEQYDSSSGEEGSDFESPRRSSGKKDKKRDKKPRKKLKPTSGNKDKTATKARSSSSKKNKNDTKSKSSSSKKDSGLKVDADAFVGIELDYEYGSDELADLSDVGELNAQDQEELRLDNGAALSMVAVRPKTLRDLSAQDLEELRLENGNGALSMVDVRLGSAYHELPTILLPVKSMLITMIGRAITPHRVQQLVNSFQKDGLRVDWVVSIRAAWTNDDVPDRWIAALRASFLWGILTPDEQNRIQYHSKGCTWLINGNHRMRALCCLSQLDKDRWNTDLLKFNSVV